MQIKVQEQYVKKNNQIVFIVMFCCKMIEQNKGFPIVIIFLFVQENMPGISLRASQPNIHTLCTLSLLMTG